MRPRWIVATGVAVLALAVAGCGGANEEDVAQIIGTPAGRRTATPTVPAGALGGVTAASRISFQAGSKIDLEMFDEQGRCLLNVTDEILALVGDYRGRAVPAGTLIGFFVASGRGIIESQAATDSSGIATATFRSLCPSNARDPIITVAAVRGAEPFVDLNSNGRRDANEPFTDLPREAFLDANQDGAFQPELGEYMIWDPNNNGRFDAGGNGSYDLDNIIVDEALILPQQKASTPGPETPGSETPGTATPTTPTTPVSTTPTPTATPSVVPASLQVALFSNQASDNNDGTISSVITAQVSDADGVALDGVAVTFRILPPVPSGLGITSPSFTGEPVGCNLGFTVPQQPGSAMSCITYDSTLQGAMVTLEARIETPSGPMLRTQSILLPDIRPIPPITSTAVPTSSPSVTPTPKPVPKFLQLALYSNLVSQNSDGTFSTALTAVVGDKDGVALDNVLVNFKLVPARAGVVVTSPGVTGAELPCVINFPPPIPPPPPQPGDALTCVKYDTLLQGQTVVVEATIETIDGTLTDSTSIVLPLAGAASAELAEHIDLALIPEVAENNGDGTYSVLVSALVGDKDGIALDGINVEFRQLPPVISGVNVTSPQITGTGSTCDFSQTNPAKRGQALSCLKYGGALGGQTVQLEARLKRARGDLVATQSIVLPDFRRPTHTVTPTPTPPIPTASATPSPSATATTVADSIQFVRAEPSAIGVRESGLPEQSRLTFRVTNAANQPVFNAAVTFQLFALGGERLSNLEARTNADGLASTVLTSGTRAAAIRVTAGADVNGDGVSDVFAQSTQIAVLGAPPSDGRFSLAAERLNIAGRRYSGIQNRITAFVNDRFGNAVPPGTTVAFVSNGSSVVNPSPSDTSGIAGATVISDASVPPSGIVTVLAFTRGEESFQDVNGDGVFQAGVDFITGDDVAEPYVGYRPHPPFDSGCPILPPSHLCRLPFLPATPYDLFVDSDGNQRWNSQGRSGQWDQDILVWDAFPITFSGTLSEVSASPTGFDLEPGGSQLFTLLVHDDLRNPLVGGSIISITTSVGTIAGGRIVVPDGQSFNQLIDGLTRFHFVLSNPLSSPGGTATVVATIESENGGGTFVLASGSMQRGMTNPDMTPTPTAE